jgi:hypothetical protein
MVNKLEIGSTLQSSSCSYSKSQQIKTQLKKFNHVQCIKCLNMGHYASMCPPKEDQQLSSKRKKRLSQRRCFGCKQKGHKISECVSAQNRRLRNQKPEAPVLAEPARVKLSIGFHKAQRRFEEGIQSQRQEKKHTKLKHKLC